MAEGGERRRLRPSASRMRPQQPRPSNVAAMWQPCGSDKAATVDNVTPDLPCPRSTRR
jgi:hypothetical protein